MHVRMKSNSDEALVNLDVFYALQMFHKNKNSFFGFIDSMMGDEFNDVAPLRNLADSLREQHDKKITKKEKDLIAFSYFPKKVLDANALFQLINIVLENSANHTSAQGAAYQYLIKRFSKINLPLQMFDTCRAQQKFTVETVLEWLKKPDFKAFTPETKSYSLPLAQETVLALVKPDNEQMKYT